LKLSPQMRAEEATLDQFAALTQLLNATITRET